MRLVCLIILFGLLGCSTYYKPNKLARVKVVTFEGVVDTLNVEYYNNLHISNPNVYVNDLVDDNGNTKATGIRRFSLVSDIKEVK